MAKRIHPLDTNTNVAVGLDLPLVSSDNNFFKLNYTTLDQAKANLKNLLLTGFGERYMMPTFGCNLKKSLFNQNNIVITEVRDSIELTVAKWMPYIIIDNLIIKVAESNEMNVYIQIFFSLSFDPETTDSIEMNVTS